MKIGCPKEIKTHEYRVGITPAGVKVLVSDGHEVYVQSDCGTAIGFNNESYQQAGATVLDTAEEVFSSAQLIVKVKELQPSEYQFLKPDHTLFTYLHLAADAALTEALIQSNCICIAYETVTDDKQQLPLLLPMSIVAGKLATQVGAHYLEKAQGGRGVLLGGADSAPPGKVLVLGAGVVGYSAAQVAVGFGAKVQVCDLSDKALAKVKNDFGERVETINNSQLDLTPLVAAADLVVGGVLVPGGKAPTVVTREMIKAMQTGSVVVDVAIDQGGCFETSRPTSHDNPVYVEEGVTHYCVTNIPSTAAFTATEALTRRTLPYISELANKGVEKALLENPGLMDGLNVYQGKVTYENVAVAHNKVFCSSEEVLGL